MKYLFFNNTPAHVHLYKHAVRALQDQGHEVRILGRDYGCTTELLEYYDLPYTVYGACGTSKSSLFRELPSHYYHIVRETLRYDPDLVFGVGAYAAHAGAVSRTPVVLVSDSEPSGLDHALSRPFAHSFLTPHTFEKDLGSNHYVFRGFKECAYLHPDVFEPDPDIRERLGVEPDEQYAILRFNAFGSSHDVGQSGFTPERRDELIERLSDHLTVFISDEKGDMDLRESPARPFDLPAALLHDALAEADVLVADTQTMVTEAALLGTPAVRSNSFVGADDMGNFKALERAGLIYNVAEFEAVIETAVSLVEADDAAEMWARRRDEFMADKVNLTDLIVDVASSPASLRKLDTKASYDRRHASASL